MYFLEKNDLGRGEIKWGTVGILTLGTKFPTSKYDISYFLLQKIKHLSSIHLVCVACGQQLNGKSFGQL
jgi:hypothetical protein